MHLQRPGDVSPRVRRFMPLARCPHCSDLMVAAQASEFVEGGEIRHHWACDACGEDFKTTVVMPSH